MPRNPNKKHCEWPGCRNWAMRGYDECRSHLDPVLGPRGAGAPAGNLNALKTGEHINPASTAQLRRLAHQIVQQPDDFDQHISAHVDDLYTRVGYGAPGLRAIRTIIALQETTDKLIPFLADALFVAEVEFIAALVPRQHRVPFKHRVWELLAPYSPLNRLIAIVQYKNSVLEKKKREAEEQLAEHSDGSNP